MKHNIIVLVLMLFSFLIGVSVKVVIGTQNIRLCYKQGQIDAINGIIYWELQKQKDGSVEWVHVGKNKE